MSDTSQGEGWWVASDGKWYAPEQHPDYVAPVKPDAAFPAAAAETVALPQPDVPGATPGPAFVPAADSAAAPTETFEGHLADPDYNLPAADAATSSKRSLILGIGAVVLIAGLGFLAFRFFSGSSAAGGASSPEEAIDQLIASVNERDAVGFVDVFDPDEIEAWIGSFAPATAKFEELSAESGVEASEITDVYASIFDSFDYSLTGPDGEAVTYDLEPLDSDGRITRVRVDGLDFEVSVGETDTAVIGAFGSDASAIDVSVFDGARLELRDERAGLAARLFVPDESPVDEFAEAHIDLVTVQKDGKWFVSIGYTFLELARGQGAFDGYPEPDFGRAFDLVENQTGGSESPEAVVQEMFDSAESLDYATIFELVDPLGTPYLHDYQVIIDSEVNEQDRREAAADAQLRFDPLELSTSQWEGRTLVTFDTLSAQVADGSVMLDTANWCLAYDDGFDNERVCAEDGIAELLLEAGSDLDPRDFIPEETGIVVIERNGRWYLDPLGTMGFYADQIADISTQLADEFDGNPATELGEFFFAEGPIARQGQPAVSQAESGSVGVALDLSEYPTLQGDFTEFNVAVARVVTDQPGTFLTYSELALEGETWVVAYDTSGDDPELPAIAAITDGELDVELFEPTVTEVGPDGFSGQFGGQGRPQLFFFDPGFSADAIEVQGATAQTIYGWDSNGVVYDDPFEASTFVSQGAFIVVFGEPNATFSISADQPAPEPEPEPEPELDVVDPFVVNDAFAAVVEPQGFTFSNEQLGGYFDGCGGPDDPDVTSFVYEDADGDLLIVTPYPSIDRAITSFDQLVNVASPCDAFDSIEVNDVVFIDIDNVRIEWQLIDDPSSIVFEHYRLINNTVVVATSGTVVGLDDQLLVLESWAG